MDNTLLGVIVGGVIALLPSLASVIVSLVNEHRKQQHEMEMKRIEWECSAKIEAIRQYSESIGVCMANQTTHAYRDYMANFERLSLYVSEETFKVMIDIGNPSQIDPDDPEMRALTKCLRKEMLSASSSHAPARDHQQKRTGKAAQKLHHFFSQCRAAILPQPSNPADPVERRTDRAERKG